MASSAARIALFVFALASLQGCGLILGSGKRVDTKSGGYKIHRLDQESGHYWKPISTGRAPIKAEDAGVTEQEPEVADVAYEHSHSKAVTSLNSVCTGQSDIPLKELAKNLVMGLPNLTLLEEGESKVDEMPAWDETVETREPGKKPVRIRAIVARKGGCTYDFMYVAQASVFPENLPDFMRFVKGFHAP